VAVDMNRQEIERIRNLVTGFGWVMTNEQVTDEDIIVTMKKKRVVPVSDFGVGPD